MKILYLLALAQLVGGPLVLLQVTLFCKLTFAHNSGQGWLEAARVSLNSDEFRTGPQLQTMRESTDGKSKPAPQDPSKMEKSKAPMIEWADSPMRHSLIELPCMTGVHDDSWTPTWPHAPPGPPPRVG